MRSSFQRQSVWASEGLMPQRYSKGFRPVLLAAAKRQLSHGIRTKFLFEAQAQQARLQKAIRQLCRKRLRQLRICTQNEEAIYEQRTQRETLEKIVHD
jgi:hypothetical protein